MWKAWNICLFFVYKLTSHNCCLCAFGRTRRFALIQTFFMSFLLSSHGVARPRQQTKPCDLKWNAWSDWLDEHSFACEENRHTHTTDFIYQSLQRTMTSRIFVLTTYCLTCLFWGNIGKLFFYWIFLNKVLTWLFSHREFICWLLWRCQYIDGIHLSPCFVSIYFHQLMEWSSHRHYISNWLALVKMWYCRALVQILRPKHIFGTSNSLGRCHSLWLYALHSIKTVLFQKN